jgi:hypothetical protein
MDLFAGGAGQFRFSGEVWSGGWTGSQFARSSGESEGLRCAEQLAQAFVPRRHSERLLLTKPAAASPPPALWSRIFCSGTANAADQQLFSGKGRNWNHAGSCFASRPGITSRHNNSQPETIQAGYGGRSPEHV